MVDCNIKGATGEKEVAKKIGAWWNLYDSSCKFRRTPMSGAWGTAEARGEMKVAGDICTTSPDWPFTVEVKRREKWSLGVLIKGERSKVWSWWRQTISAAAEEDRTPMLWFRKSRAPWLIMLPVNYAGPRLVSACVKPDIIFGRINKKVDYGDLMPLCILADKFLQTNPVIWLPNTTIKTRG